MSIPSLRGQIIDVVLSRDIFFQGKLVDSGKDIIVLFNGQKYIYIPLTHLHRVNRSSFVLNNYDASSKTSRTEYVDESISYRTTLANAKGRFSEIYVTGQFPLHGYIFNVRSDYFAFYSPVYKTMLVSLQHLKWLIPYYDLKTTPYSLPDDKLPVIPYNQPLLPSLEEQLKKWEGELVVFDLGEDPMKIGLLKSVRNPMVEIVVAHGESVHLKLSHIKSVHLP